MAKKRYVHKTVRPSDGGRLLTATSEETVGISNYVEKLNFRRELDGEIRREGWKLLDGHQNIKDGDMDVSGSVRLLHEFTDHLGNPRLLAERNGNIFAFVPTTGTEYCTHTPSRAAVLVVTKVSGGAITEVIPRDKGYGYPAGYVTLTAGSGGASLTANVVGTYIDTVSVVSGGSGYSVGDLVTATIDRYDAIESSQAYWNEAEGVSGWKLIASGLHHLDDGTSGVRRWECVEVDGHAILNNGFDLPLIYKSDWDSAKPLYGLRENKVASVGTIQSFDGRLVCGDIVEIDKGFDLVRGSSSGAYSCVYDLSGYGSDITTRRNQYSLLWSAYGEPWLFNQSLDVSIERNSVICASTHSDFAANKTNATFSVGDPVYVTGAGQHGGRLSLKHGGNATITGITGQSANDVFTKTKHGLDDGERIRVIQHDGGGPIEGDDYYVVYLTEDTFKLSITQTRQAKATPTLNGSTLSIKIDDHGAGYQSAPAVTVTGFTQSSGTAPVAVISSIGQVVKVADTLNWSTTTATAPAVEIARPASTPVDITTSMTSMIITKPDLVDSYRAILDEAIAQVSKVGITRTVPSSAPTVAFAYQISINNEVYLLTNDPTASPAVEDFAWDSTAETIAKQFADKINSDSTEVTATSDKDGLTLTAKMAGSGFSLGVSDSDTDGDITSSTTTLNSAEGASDSDLDEAYIELYGTQRGFEDEALSFNNAITITDIEGPFGMIVANGALVPTPTSSYLPQYDITFVIDAGLPSEITETIRYDFATWYNSGGYSSYSTSSYPDIVGSAFVAGLARTVYDHPVLGNKVKVSAYGFDTKQPYMWYWPEEVGGTVDITAIQRVGSTSYTGQDDPWENIATWATEISGGYYYHASAGYFYWDGSSEWVYVAYDASGANTTPAWVYVGRYDDSFYFTDGLATYKPKPEWQRRIYLDAYAETTNTTAELHRSVSIAGGIVFDISLGSGYQDWQEDGSTIMKMEPIGDHLACYRENGYFITSQTGDVKNPFSFKTRYVGRNVPSFRHTVMLVGGKKHVYAGYEGIYELSLAQPQPIPSVELAAATDFWEEISEAESEYVFAIDNVVTSEHFIHLPKGYKTGSSIHTIAFDYKYGSVSEMDAEITASASCRQPSTDVNPAPNDYSDYIFLMSIDDASGNGHYVAKYGLEAASGNQPRSAIYYRHDIFKNQIAYDSKLRFGLIAFGDTFNEKDMRSYILHTADVNASVGVEVYTAYTTAATASEKFLFGEENDPNTAIILSDLKNENAIPLYLRAPLFQDQLVVTGTTAGNSIKFLGRTFEVGGVYDRAAMQMIGIGGSVDVSS
ncbi:MAG: hypothetical protein Unbinned3806contig1000_39 [Prokaryotic dsDNA virus sp.]|nr:MAG: hypothetical protein Unbinned3806contig1000_39 [Prokaryotic dsDNA virus sp.]|tara:strand:- start:28237 stop:32181 length:3945 start_codon:yes stop_codon:yes gene_type:complete